MGMERHSEWEKVEGKEREVTKGRGLMCVCYQYLTVNLLCIININ